MALFDSQNPESFDPMQKYQGLAATTGDSLSMPEQIIGGSIAAIADVGTTLWNSLTPERMEVSTQDLLSRVNSDALQVYNENTDTVRTASFIGGLFLPVGFAMKGMSLLRSGAKGASWFSEAGKVSNLARAEKAFKEAGPVNDAFIKAKWDIYRNVAANNILDSAVAEFAILATMSAHPYMEDYTKNLGTNFAIGLAFGGVVGTGLGSIIAKGQLNRLVAPIEKEGNKILLDTLRKSSREAGISEISHLGEMVAVRSQNIENLKDLVAKAKAPGSELTLQPYTIARLEATIQSEGGQLYDVLKNASKGELTQFIESAPEASKQFLLDFTSRTENAGLDKIAFATVSDTKLAGKGSGMLTQTVEFMQDVFNKKTGLTEPTKVDAFYSSVFGRYFGKNDQVNYLTMADLGKTIDDLEKGLPKRGEFKFGRAEASIENEVEHSAKVDLDFARQMLAVEKMEASDLKGLVLHPEDLSRLKAVYLRAKELGLSEMEIRITKAKPSYEAIQRQILKRSGVDPDYGRKLRGMEKDWDRYSLYNHGRGRVGAISENAERALANWVGGGYRNLRNAAAVEKGLFQQHKDLLKPAMLEQVEAHRSILREIADSPQSRLLRQDMAKIADPDGYVWLYRGMNREPSGHMTLESYSILAEKAAEFGKGYNKAVKLYKVHVDDIVGTVRDFGPTGKKPEILAYPPTREFHNIAKTNLKAMPDEIILQETGESIVKAEESLIRSLGDVETAIQAEMLRAVKDLSKAGYGIEAISLRTATPIDTISEILSTGYVPPGGLFKYTSRQDIEMALQTEKRTLALSTTPTKNISAEMFAKLNAMDLDKTSAGISEMYLLTSPSTFVQELGKAFISADFKALSGELLRELDSYVGTGLKSTLFSSANQVLSDLPGLAAVATVMGKEAVALRNFTKETFEKPISIAMGAVLKDGAALIEANTALNLNSSLSGFRVYKDGQFWTKAINESGEEVLEAVTYQGKEFVIQSESVKNLIEHLQIYGREMYEMKSAYTKAIGRGGVADIGFWVPSVNLSNKEIAYVHDVVTDKTTMLFAKTPEELNDGIAAFKKSMLSQNREIQVVTKDQQEMFNKLAGRHDPMYMEMADISKRHGGSAATTFVATDASAMQEILSGYNNYVNRNIDDLISLQLSPILDHLKNLSDLSQTGYSQMKGNVIQKLANKPVDAGMVLQNIILGKPNLNQHKGWSELQQRGQVATDMLMSGITDAFAPIVGKTVRTPEMWQKTLQDMEARGIHNPFDSLDKEFALGRYMAEGKPGKEGLTPRAVSLFNAFAATSLLRFMELGQPLVNAVSLPILTSGAVNKKMASSFFGATLDPNAKFTLSQIMHDGIRFMNHPIEGAKWSKLGEAKNLFTAELRNITELMEHSRSLDPGLMQTAEDLLESSVVKFLSKPSDYSEGMVRKVSFFNGVALAKQAYPGLSDVGVLTFARNFMDEAVGNYTAQQRPAMFQGTFGVSFGLFQTYMLTLAQQIYRGVQNRDWASLGKQMLTQATIFGGASLPGFHLVSEQIGKHFSDQNIDLQTGTFRAIPDPVANMLLYGLPSSLGPGINTRGDIQPRVPNPFQGISSVAAVNIAGQTYTAMERVASAAWSADENAGRAMLEALALQSVSRPIARMSELITGTALTGAGNVVASGSEIYNTQGVISRIFSTRPLAEIKVRQAMQLDSLYGQADSDRRKAVAKRLKTHIRSGRLDPETLDELAYEYLRTGTPTGWRGAVNEALTQQGGDGSDTVKRKLGPTSPLQMMIEDLD